MWVVTEGIQSHGMSPIIIAVSQKGNIAPRGITCLQYKSPTPTESKTKQHSNAFSFALPMSHKKTKGAVTPLFCDALFVGRATTMRESPVNNWLIFKESWLYRLQLFLHLGSRRPGLWGGISVGVQQMNPTTDIYEFTYNLSATIHTWRERSPSTGWNALILISDTKHVQEK